MVFTTSDIVGGRIEDQHQWLVRETSHQAGGISSADLDALRQRVVFSVDDDQTGRCRQAGDALRGQNAVVNPLGVWSVLSQPPPQETRLKLAATSTASKRADFFKRQAPNYRKTRDLSAK